MRDAQARGAVGDVASARRDMDRALDLLAEVAAAHVSPGRDAPSETARRRIQELLRRAVALDETRDALRHGRLLEEPAPVGFAALAGVTVEPKPKAGAAAEARAGTRRRGRRRGETAGGTAPAP